MLSSTCSFFHTQGPPAKISKIDEVEPADTKELPLETIILDDENNLELQSGKKI